MRSEPDRIEKCGVVPGLEYAAPNKIGKVDLALSPVIVTEPKSKVR